MEYEQLKLSNQLCFPVYAASRLITREYQPYLDKMGITYPQYLVLMVLWESDGISVNEIAQATPQYQYGNSTIEANGGPGYCLSKPFRSRRAKGNR